MTTRFTGGCICGAIRYECVADPIAMGNCHCRDCQRATGSAFAAAILAPTSTVNMTGGEVKYYEVIGDSGAIVRRGFCPNCGARLFGNPAASPDITDIMAGSLDDPSCYQPRANMYTASAQSWDYESGSAQVPQEPTKLVRPALSVTDGLGMRMTRLPRGPDTKSIAGAKQLVARAQSVVEEIG